MRLCLALQLGLAISVVCKRVRHVGFRGYRFQGLGFQGSYRVRDLRSWLREPKGLYRLYGLRTFEIPRNLSLSISLSLSLSLSVSIDSICLCVRETLALSLCLSIWSVWRAVRSSVRPSVCTCMHTCMYACEHVRMYSM